MISKQAWLAGIMIIMLASCGEEKFDQSTLTGKWEATWKTDPSTFPNIDGISGFEMDGQFIFDGDSLTIVAMGYSGCVFGIDTISHTQGWKIKGDTILQLINENQAQGISYVINSVNDSKVELQLMEDIFITLNK